MFLHVSALSKLGRSPLSRLMVVVRDMRKFARGDGEVGNSHVCVCEICVLFFRESAWVFLASCTLAV
jgi:hypothetical protein